MCFWEGILIWIFRCCFHRLNIWNFAALLLETCCSVQFLILIIGFYFQMTDSACLLVNSCCNGCILNCNLWHRIGDCGRHRLRQAWTLVCIWFNRGDLVTLTDFKKVLFFHIGLDKLFICRLIGSLWRMRFCAFCVVLWRTFFLSTRHVQWSNIT